MNNTSKAYSYPNELIILTRTEVPKIISGDQAFLEDITISPFPHLISASRQVG